MSKQPLYFAIHGHFYQPPRENPWTNTIENQPSAAPYHDWNDRIAHECYSPNAASRILNHDGRIQDIVNNYEFMSFNIGPTLMSWIRTQTPDTYRRIQEADRKSIERLGHGNAIAQVYNHIIMPLATPEDRITQIRWGIADFESHFGRKPEAMWLAETAINMDVVVDLIREGIRYTILSPTQAESFRAFNGDHWYDSSEANIDTTRPYRIFPRDKDGNLICEGHLDVFFYNPWLSSAVGFEHLLRDAHVFGKRIADAWDDARPDAQLVSIGTDGESYGHHEAFGDMCAAWLYNRYAPAHGMVPVNFGWFLEHFPPQYEVQLKNIYGEGSAWSCAHGVGRWHRDCGCSTGGGPGWNQEWRTPLRDALNYLKDFADKVFLREMQEKIVVDAWEARNRYIRVLVRPEETARREEFFKSVLKNPENREDQIHVLRLLEIQKYCMFSFTSCGWFFNDMEGLEPVQNMRYALRALEIFRFFLPPQYPLENEVLGILGRAVSNEHKMNGAEVFAKFALPEVPVHLKLMAEKAAIFHLGLEDHSTSVNPVITAEKFASRRRQTIVKASLVNEDMAEEFHAMILAVSDNMGRVNLVVQENILGEHFPFLENPNASSEEIKALYPTAFVFRLRDLMSDSIKKINILSTAKHLKKVTDSFANFALSQGLSIDCLADQDHTLPDTMRKCLSMEINATIHRLALEYVQNPSDEILAQVKSLVEEATALKTKFSFGGTGRIFHQKLMKLMAEAETNLNESAVKHITGLISMADWLHLYIDKATLENQAFPTYLLYRKNPNGALSKLRPMFIWLNFEIPA
ncbi:MAG: DUF3536 domain-containing protein [Fibrobacter sp.]|jgi:hypothetical protein|nr:DUF3536 domain-containing protein [Fibrobacter sp.]